MDELICLYACSVKCDLSQCVFFCAYGYLSLCLPTQKLTVGAVVAAHALCIAVAMLNACAALAHRQDVNRDYI